jgi:plastocyanin
MRASGVLPEEFEGATMASEGTLVHDISGAALNGRLQFRADRSQRHLNHTFPNPGTFDYHCDIHGCPMAGTITAT